MFESMLNELHAMVAEMRRAFASGVAIYDEHLAALHDKIVQIKTEIVGAPAETPVVTPDPAAPAEPPVTPAQVESAPT